MAARRRGTARAAAIPVRRPLVDFGRLAPSPRSVLLGLALLVAGVGAYVGARETSAFAVRAVDVRGATPRVRAEVRTALRAEVGRSLLRVDGDELSRRLARVPDVFSVEYDRAFPHTLRVVVTRERPVLLLRRRDEGWVVSARGRVLRRVRNTHVSSLPRVWVPRDARVTVGAMLEPEDGGVAATALAPLAGRSFPGHVQFVRQGAKELTLVLRSRFEIRLGDLGDLRLKLAIARRILLALGPGTRGGYLDVSVPERPVVGTSDSQVEG